MVPLAKCLKIFRIIFSARFFIQNVIDFELGFFGASEAGVSHGCDALVSISGEDFLSEDVGDGLFAGLWCPGHGGLFCGVGV